MAKGKGKGSQWERDIAKYLTKWLTGQDKEYYFWRSPGSGSIGTVTQCNIDLHGDIIPIKPEAEFFCNIWCIECKNGYGSASLDKHLKSNKNDHIQDFWEQTVNNSIPHGKNPMLIFKKKGNPAWIGVNNKIQSILYTYLETLNFIHLRWNYEILDCYFFDMKDFFEKITPEIIKERL